jgi:hypothetical protein
VPAIALAQVNAWNAAIPAEQPFTVTKVTSLNLPGVSRFFPMDGC